MLLARKIARAKWNAQRSVLQGFGAEEIRADAITADLRTRDDALSFWRCPTGDRDELEEVALAIAAMGDRPSKLDLVWLKYVELQADGLVLKNTRGDTPVADLADMHVDVCKLDYVRLGTVARRVVAAIAEQRCCRFSATDVKQLLLAAIREKRIKLDNLKPTLKEKVLQ